VVSADAQSSRAIAKTGGVADKLEQNLDRAI